jgi:predicted alpha/beta superfamily hydrolase
VDSDSSPLAGTEVHFLQSAHVGDEFKVFVGRCGTDDVDRAAVLYVTDANGFFGLAVDIVRCLQLAAHLPPLLVVGIGYRAGVLKETIAVRTRDFTPTRDARFANLFPEQSTMGGAGAFLAFVRHELMPWVDAHYRTDPGDTTFFGHSLGGLFGTYVLLTAPQTFRRYAIGSPSLWWDNEVSFDAEQAYAYTHADLPARVFFGVGANETHAGRGREAVNYPDDIRSKATAWYIDMVDSTQRMAMRLEQRRYPNLRVALAVFADEFHVSVASLILSRALRELFDAPR